MSKPETWVAMVFKQYPELSKIATEAQTDPELFKVEQGTTDGYSFTLTPTDLASLEQEANKLLRAGK